VGLERLVDEGKSADYIGRAALDKIRREGVTRKSVGVEIAGDPIPFNPVKWIVKAGGSTAGRITSAVWSPRLKKNIGYAMLPVAHTAPRTELSVEIPGLGEQRATVVEKPFVDPDKAIPKT
jgi:aminomethyltransferase